MTKPTSEFYDDPGKALELGHNATAKRVATSPPSKNSGIEAHFAGDVDRIKARQRENLEKRMAELNKQGMSIRDARATAQHEFDNPDAPKEIHDREGKKERFIKALMRPPVTPKGGGSKSGRKRTAKKGTWICTECGLEYCEHRPVRSKGGRLPKDGQARRVRERVRLSDLTLTQLEALGLSSSDALALFAVAYRENRPLDDVIEAFKKAHRNESRKKYFPISA